MGFKKSFITITLVLIGLSCKAQKNPADKIYWLALDKYTTYLDSANNKTPSKNQEKIIYLEKPEYVDSIPPVMNNYHITLITYSNQRKLYKENNYHIIHTKMLPLTIDSSTLRISFIPFLEY
jgi:hypothetical protein